LLFDLHTHSEHSFDSRNRVDDVLRTARERGLAGIAISDHESFEGAREALRKAPAHGLLVIPAMEVATEEGDVIGLFLSAPIRSRRFAEVADEIRKQGGVVYYPHPYKRRSEIPRHVLESIDVLEVWNARGEAIGGRRCNARAEALAAREGLPRGAGSDAHFLFEIGRGAVDLGEVRNLAEARARLLETGPRTLVRCETTLFAEVASQFVKASCVGGADVRRSAWRRLGRTLRWLAWGRARVAVRRRWPGLGSHLRRWLGAESPR